MAAILLRLQILTPNTNTRNSQGRRRRRPLFYGLQLTPAGAPVGAPIISLGEDSFRNSKCCIAGGCVGAIVKKAPTMPFSHCRLNCPRSQFSGLTAPAVEHSPT